MTSHLRLQSSFEHPISTGIYQTSPTRSHPAKKQKMSLTQTYYVASTARTKLGREAGKSDHNLRLLVGHANLLDTLMVELADAERQQEAWFNKSVQKAAPQPEKPAHISWAIDEEMEDDDSDMSDNGSDIYDEDDDDDDVLFNLPLRRIRSPPIQLFSHEIEEDEDEDFTDEDEEVDSEEQLQTLSLQRVTSQHSPPELTLDSDEESDSDDDSMPSSPEQPTFDISDKERQAITTTSFYTMDAVMQQQRQQPMIAAC